MNKIKIDPEFRDRIPTADDGDLKQMLERDGCLDPLIVWKGHDTLIDGHRRKKICDKLGIGFRTKELAFETREDVLQWIDRMALTHRILTADQTSLIRGRIYNSSKLSVEHTLKRGDKTDQKSLIFPGDHFDPPENAADRIAKETGVSAPTVKRDGAFAAAVEHVKAVDPEIENKIAAGDAPPKTTIIKAAKAKTKKAAIAILAGKDPEPTLDPKYPAKVRASFETIAAFKGMLQLCTQLTAGIGKLCGDANGKGPAKGGELLAGSRQEALMHVKNLRNLLDAYCPYAVCPYCKAVGAKCQACKGLGWVAEQTFEQAPKETRLEALVA